MVYNRTYSGINAYLGVPYFTVSGKGNLHGKPNHNIDVPKLYVKWTIVAIM